jgi:hypothetical protein
MLDKVLRSWRNLVVAVGALGAAFAVTPSADAATINFASFGIGGAFSLPAGSHLGTTNSIIIGNGGLITVTQGDIGDLSGIINFGNSGTLADIPSLSAFTPIANYLTLNGNTIRLDLNTLVVHSQSGPTPGYINASGNGTLYAPGYDPTEAKVSLTGTTTDNLGFVIAVQTSVPEPLPIALLGLGLLGLFFSRRAIAGRLSTQAVAA